MWVFVLAFVALAAYAGYVLVTLPALKVHAIDVTVDGLQVTERQVLDAAQIDRTSNVWLLDTAAIARRIEAIPYVDGAEIRRAFPAHLGIAVTERRPAACVSSGGRAITIDAARRILQAGCEGSSSVVIEVANLAPGAPGSSVTAANVATLLADAQTLESARVPLRSLKLDRFGGLVGIEPDGVAVLFGTDVDLAEKAKLVAPVLAAVRPGRTIRALDLRAPATPIVDFGK
jgi:cell division protein FtsQ